jgi:diacylglycerol kinase family enzyme
MRGVERHATTEVLLTGDERIPYQLDGDPAGHLPVTARATPERVWVRVPRTDRGPGTGDRGPV